MINENQSRRKFISQLGLGGATAGLTLLAGISHATNPGFSWSKDSQTAHSELNGDSEKWLRSLEGKTFPIVFDMHEHKDFWAGIWSNIYLMTNAGENNLGIAIVIRHGGYPFALNNTMWEKYKLGELNKIIDKNTGVVSTRNMYWEPTGHDYPLPGLSGIKALLDKGVNFCVCNMALKVYGNFIAQANGLPADAVYNDFVANILPGIQLVPAGVWALGRLQQSPLGYGYVNAG